MNCEKCGTRMVCVYNGNNGAFMFYECEKCGCIEYKKKRVIVWEK